MEKSLNVNRNNILVRCLLIMLFAGILNSVSVFVKPLATYYQWSTDAIANVSTTMLFIWTPGALLGGWLMSKIGAKKTLSLGSVLFGAGLVLSGMIPKSAPWMLYITFSFMQGLGNGMAYTAATYVATGWYPDKRGLATGLCMAFNGGSSAFLAPLCSKLTLATNIKVTLIVVGLVSGLVCLFSALGISQAPLGYVPAGYKPKEKKAGDDTQLASYTIKKALKTRPIWNLIICTAFFPTIYMIMFPRFSVFMTDAGFDVGVATLGVSIYFIANTVSRLVLGALCDKISYKYVYMICGGFCVLSAVCLITASSLAMFYLGYIFLGLGFGATNSVYPVAINESYGPVYAGGIYGVALFGYMIFCTQITPRIHSALVASTGSYTASFIYGIILTCIAVLSMSLIPKVNRPTIAEAQAEEAKAAEAAKK
jgi:OFA family oxalate/formate antiporter-like MFS transporter